MSESYEINKKCYDLGYKIGSDMARDLKSGADHVLIGVKYNSQLGRVRQDFGKAFPDSVDRFNRLGDVNMGMNLALKKNGCGMLKIPRD